jgi:5'-deoxynucleotidase
VKAADKMSALIKCIEEQSMGNHDFDDAAVTIEKALVNMKLAEVDYFMKEFLPAYRLTLDKSGKEV